MTDFENYSDRRRQWKEEKRKMREEWRARYGKDSAYVMGGMYSGGGGVWTGVFIIVIGLALLIRSTVPDIPSWFFSWKTLLIALGLFIGFRHHFKGVAWFVLILVGSVFLIQDIAPDLSVRQYIWPVALITIGGFLIFQTVRSRVKNNAEKKSTTGSGVEISVIADEAEDSKEDFIHATSIFSGTKKNVLSKNFRGGDLVSIFGGTELDLSRADVNGTATLDLTTIFGGTKLVVPSNWEVKSEAAVIFGGIEDKRTISPSPEGTPKRLLLKGTVMFGGIDIKSY